MSLFIIMLGKQDLFGFQTLLLRWILNLHLLSSMQSRSYQENHNFKIPIQLGSHGWKDAVDITLEFLFILGFKSLRKLVESHPAYKS